MNNILVGNLSPNSTERDIRSIFEQHGTVEQFKMMTDLKTDRPRGFAFVRMKHDAEAEKAIVALDGTDLNGMALKVNPARPQIHRKRS